MKLPEVLERGKIDGYCKQPGHRQYRQWRYCHKRSGCLSHSDGPFNGAGALYNVARSATLAGGTKSVKINGCMGAIDGCCYLVSTGYLPGIGRGVVSGTVGGKAEFINCSFDVKIEGKGVCRNSDPMTQNCKNAI